MNRWKKAISAAMSAALLASLFTTAIAPAVSAAAADAAVGSAGSVPRAGTSAAAATFTFTEGDIDDWDEAGTLTVTILDSASANTLTFTGTPTLVAPDSMGASVVVGTNSFTVTTTDWDDLQKEQFSVQGLKIKAAAGAALGAIQTGYTGTGDFTTYFDPGAPFTATGTLVTSLLVGATSATVNVTSVCPFVTAASTLVFTTPVESKAFTTASALTSGQQTLSVLTPTTFAHPAGEAVSAVLAANCGAAVGVLGSAGTVVDSLKLSLDDDYEGAPVGVQPGLFNQNAARIMLEERTARFMTAGAQIAITITTAGVVFSQAPTADTHLLGGGGTTFQLTNAVANLSADRKTATWTVSTAGTLSTTYGYFHAYSNFLVDVAAGAVLGSTVDVTVTAGSLLVTPSSIQVAYINNVIAGTAATPIVFIGENDQQTGMVTLTETAVGSFTAGGMNNVFSVSLDSGYEFFTRAPFAVVTASNLKLRDPGTLLGTTSLVGVLSNSNRTATWTIYSASTDVPAMIDIRGSDAVGAVLPAGPLNGGRINVAAGSPIGTVNLDVASGTASSQTDFAQLPIAVRAFRSGVVVTVLSQPTIPAGSADSLGGDIVITESLTGQFRSGQDICVSILPRSGNNFIQDTFLKTANTNDRPVVTATPGSGLVVGPVSIGCYEDGDVATNTTNSFEFSVVQQAFSPNLGKITISNIHFITVADAPTGPVLVSVYGDNDGGATNFQTIVSNARIGTPIPAGNSATALGVTNVGPFSVSTKVAAVKKYVTYKFDFGPAAAGKTVDIYGATKTGTTWSAFTKVTSRVANASGVVYYYIRHSSATWRSYQAMVDGSSSPARQARWL